MVFHGYGDFRVDTGFRVGSGIAGGGIATIGVVPAQAATSGMGTIAKDVWIGKLQMQ